jgi:hypothetical protein
MPEDSEPTGLEQLDLLELRVTRLERIVAAQAYQPRDDHRLTAPVTYTLDDPRLILFGAYSVERTKEGLTARWFGQGGQVQMVFPHGRGCWQTVQLLMRPFKDIDLRDIRPIIDEARIVPMLTRAPAPANAFVMQFRVPPAYGFQTEIQMHAIKVGSPNGQAGASDARRLSFLLFSATFSPDGGADGAMPA